MEVQGIRITFLDSACDVAKGGKRLNKICLDKICFFTMSACNSRMLPKSVLVAWGFTVGFRREQNPEQLGWFRV